MSATCATCAQPSETWAVVRDDWRVCPDCHQQYLAANPWARLDPEQAHGLIDGGVEIICATCKAPIRPGGPIRVFVNEATGEIAKAYCGTCVRNYIERKKIEAIKSEILVRVHRGRSKGLLTKEMMAEGRHLADIRQSFEELLDDGELVQHKSLVRRPSAKARQEALFS
jgi:hypothetical protein